MLQKNVNRLVAIGPTDAFFFFFLTYLPLFLDMPPETQWLLAERKARTMFSNYVSETSSCQTWRDEHIATCVRKARGRAGERLHWQTRKLCSQDWQLERPMGNHQDGITSGVFFFFFLIFTTQNMEVAIVLGRPDFLWSVFQVRTPTLKFETRITQQRQRLYK